MSFRLADVTYEITNELVARKILESHTEWYVEFNKNYGDLYGYDIACYKHTEDGTVTGYHKRLVGYVEIEVYQGDNWQPGRVPPNWKEITFLKRKVFKWAGGEWSPDPRDGYDRVVYLKFNRDFTDCFACHMATIYNHGVDSPRSDGTYKHSFVSVPREMMAWGIEDCVTDIVQLGEEW